VAVADPGSCADRPPSEPAPASPTPAATPEISATLPLGSVGFEPEPNAEGERMIWLDAAVVDRLSAMPRPGESYSDVILRLVELEARSKLSWLACTASAMALSGLPGLN